MKRQPLFLPLTREEGIGLGIDSFDVIIVSGDAYVDHPSFASALLGRALWEKGYPTAIIPQPDWTRAEDFKRLGAPRLFFAVSSGAVDPMVNHYTRRRSRGRGMSTLQVEKERGRTGRLSCMPTGSMPSSLIPRLSWEE